jgi:hypothetical protein
MGAQLCVKLDVKIESLEDHLLKELLNTNLDQEDKEEKPMMKGLIPLEEVFPEDK